MITKQWTVRSIVLLHPHIVGTLTRLGIAPAQAYLSVEAVALRLDKSPDELVDELTQAANSS